MAAVGGRHIESFDHNSTQRLEDYLELRHLEQLRRHFDAHNPRREVVDPSVPYKRHRSHRVPGRVNVAEFKDIVGNVIGDTIYSNQLDNLFAKLDTTCDGHVDWDEFCTYLLLYFRESDSRRDKVERPFLTPPVLRHVTQNRQMPSANVLIFENPLRLSTISKVGAITVWDSGLHYEASYALHREAEDVTRSAHMWVMGATVMENCHKVAVVTTAREVRFFDVATGSYHEEFLLYGLPNIPTCVTYYFNPKKQAGKSLLFCGDDFGNIYMFVFINPIAHLFDLPTKSDKLQRIWMEEIGHHQKFVRYSLLANIHGDNVCQLQYIADNFSTLSCSPCHERSVVNYDVQRRRALYTFRLRRGCECYDVSRRHNVLVTGGSDYLVRLWNPYVTNRAQAALTGHAAPITAVRILETFNVAISYAKDTVIKVWDIKEYVCLQTVNFKIPFLQPDKLPDHLSNPMTYHASTNRLYLSVGDYIVSYKLGSPPAPAESGPISHNTQLCAAIYNPLFKQVATGSDDSTLTTWDFETGDKCLMFNNAHENEEITCLSFDHSWRRLISGARNGSVKVWNVQNGHNLHRLEPVADAEVTGAIAVRERKLIITVGWARTIAMYADDNADNHYLKADTSWKGGFPHKDDVIACDVAWPQLLATASHDGEIVVWSIETEKIIVRLRDGYTEKLSRKISRMQGIELPPSPEESHRPNSRHRSSHKPADGYPPPVDKLLFLRNRAVSKSTRSALLVSSEAGTLRWWSIFDQQHEMNFFYAASTPDESILALASDSFNTILLSGDTVGHICMWKIENYATVYNNRHVGRQPTKISDFQAHVQPIVSVELVEHPAGNFVLTASVDKTARVFTVTGEPVGIFGQSKPWDIKNVGTWEYYRRLESERLLNKSKSESVSDSIPATPNPRIEGSSNEPFITKVTKEITVTGATLSDPGPSCSSDITMPERSKTFGDFETEQRGLGYRVNSQFDRMRKSREVRRDNFGDVHIDRAFRFGKSCSPFAALSLDVCKPALHNELKEPATLTNLLTIGDPDISKRLPKANTLPVGNNATLSDTKQVHPGRGMRREKTWAVITKQPRPVAKLPPIY